jgi:hypothetical protein
MDIGLTMDELAARMPFEEYIPITEAARILGGGNSRVTSLMELVRTSGLSSWSHSSPYCSPGTFTLEKTGLIKELPNITPDTDPATVLVDSKDVLWRWCVELECLFLGIEDKNLPPRDKVEARFNALKSLSIELKTGSKPAPLGGAGIAATAPATRWPWGDHHTEALGHMEAAAQRFWVNYDPADASTAPTNQRVVDWLRQERTVSPNLAKSIASILRQDGLPSGPR